MRLAFYYLQFYLSGSSKWFFVLLFVGGHRGLTTQLWLTYVGQAGLELRGPPASASQVQELMTSIINAQLTF